MKKYTLVLFLLACSITYSQGNCLAYPENSGERKACELSYKAIEFAQGSKESLEIFDEAIAICPNYAYAYYQKSVPYLKRGFVIEGLALLDNAVKLEPLSYLCYRAYWFWQYKNYALCIRDLENFYNNPKAYPSYTPGGEKNMKVIIALCYAKTEQYSKAISILENHIEEAIEEDFIGLSDYYTLGFMHFKNNDAASAIKALNLQLKINADLAETYYYLGLAYKSYGDFKEAEIQFNKALLKYNDSDRFFNINSGFPLSEITIKNEVENLKSLKP